jgi:two-component system chemotaxis response regulator CheY
VLSVAVIEDDLVTLDIITNALETRLGATVYPFSRSKVAREFLMRQTSSTLSLVVSDQIMPTYDGLSLLKICRAAQLDVPFLLITADPNRKLVTEAKQLGVSGFLAKPLSMDKLAAKVNAVIGG